MLGEYCLEFDNMRFPYTALAMAAMFMYFALLIDISVISTRISAFVLVCVRMVAEVALFLGAGFCCILTFSSGMSVLKAESADDFAGIQHGGYALFRMFIGAYSPERYAVLRQEPTLLALVFIFGIVVVFFLLNMLIAQLSCAYSAVYEDMLGYARLKRSRTIVEIMPSIPKIRWQMFVTSLRLHKKLEFNLGDVGVSGGIPMKEAANLNPTTVDTIRRFGGSTSPELQWPEDKEDGEGDDRMERIEKLIQRAMHNFSGATRRKKGGAGSSQGNTGTGTGQSGSGQGDNKSGGSSNASEGNDHGGV